MLLSKPVHKLPAAVVIKKLCLLPASKSIKSKILEFINSVLANTNDKDDEGPIYINLLNKAKNKVKDSKQKNKLATPNIYNSNLPKDKY